MRLRFCALLLVCFTGSVFGDLIPIDIDTSQMQGAARRVYPQIPNADLVFPIDGSSFDHTFQFTEMEFLDAQQDFSFGLTIFLDTTAALSLAPTYNATWEFLGPNLVPLATFNNLKVEYRDPLSAVPRLNLTNETAMGSVLGSMGWDIHGIRVAATLPDLISAANPASIAIVSPNPVAQEGAEFALSGSAAGAWQIAAVPEPSPLLFFAGLALPMAIRRRLGALRILRGC